METEPSPPAPAVVAVVVTSEPGPWLATALASIEAQDYPNLSVLVVDAGCAEDPTPVVAAAMPSAFVRRIGRPVGYGRAANEVLEIVEGASHYLFCHDDVAFDADALRLMVEEAFRSNAGIVSPKFVRWEEPDRLLAVGLTTDKVGVRRNLVEPNELDQEQHDSVREILVAPGGATLVRADLFRAMGGYHPMIDDHGEDMDLSWRARLYGARVVVAPAARVRHLEGPTCPAPPIGAPATAASADLTDRNRYRTLVTCYRFATLMWIVPLAALWALGESITLALQGRPTHARRVLSSLVAGLGGAVSLRQTRSEVARHRTGSDADLRAMQVKGNIRLRSFVQGRVDEVRTGLERQGIAARLAVDPDEPQFDADGRVVAPPGDRSGAWPRRLRWAVPLLILAVFIVGSRSLFGLPFPQIGVLPNTTAGFGAIWHDWWSTWQPAGLGVAAPSSPGLALLGLLDIAFLGAVGTLAHVVVLGPLLFGPLGMWRAARHWGSPNGRKVAAAAYAVVPLPYNALAGGHWDALVVYAGLPWAVSALIRLSEVVPAPRIALSRTPGRIVALGLVVAVVASVAPSFLYLFPTFGLCLFAGSALNGFGRAGIRLVGLAVASSLIAIVVMLPWSITVVTSKMALAGPSLGPGGRIGFGQILRFHTGPYGSGVWEWLLLAAAALPLVVGRGWRLEWAVRMWLSALVFFAWAWAGSRGWVPALPVDIVLAPAAVALALSCGLGVSAFEIDLPGYNFGWRQAAAPAAAICLTAAAIPWIVSTAGGRWDLPDGDASATLSYLPSPSAGDYRVLWVGYPSALPLDSRELQAGVGYATSTDGEPDLTEDFATGPAGASGQLATDLNLVQSGRVTDLGHLLAPAGVLYIVVPNHVGPSTTNAPAVAVPQSLLSGFNLQTDLQPVVGDPNYLVYQNSAWAPTRLVLPAAATTTAGLSGEDLTRQLPMAGLEGAPAALTGGSEDVVSGRVQPGQVLEVGSTRSDGWHLNVGRHTIAPTPSFGWAMSFAVPNDIAAGAEATLGYDPPPVERAAVVLGAVLWVVGLVYVLRDRRRRVRAATVEETDPRWFLPASAARPAPRPRWSGAAWRPPVRRPGPASRSGAGTTGRRFGGGGDGEPSPEDERWDDVQSRP